MEHRWSIFELFHQLYHQNCVRRVHRDFSFIINIHYVMWELSIGTMKSDDNGDSWLSVRSRIEIISLKVIWCFHSNATSIQSSNELFPNDLGFLRDFSQLQQWVIQWWITRRCSTNFDWCTYLAFLLWLQINLTNCDVMRASSRALRSNWMLDVVASIKRMRQFYCHQFVIEISFVRTSPSEIDFETVSASNRVSRNNSSKIRVVVRCAISFNDTLEWTISRR